MGPRWACACPSGTGRWTLRRGRGNEDRTRRRHSARNGRTPNVSNTVSCFLSSFPLFLLLRMQLPTFPTVCDMIQPWSQQQQTRSQSPQKTFKSGTENRRRSVTHVTISPKTHRPPAKNALSEGRPHAKIPFRTTPSNLQHIRVSFDNRQGPFYHHGFRPECAMLRQEEDG